MQNHIFKGGSHAILRQISQYSLEKPHHCCCHPSGSRRTLCLDHQRRMKAFETVNQPPLTPPMWLFPVVWSILFVLMGIASYLVVMQKGEDTKALTLYAVQLIFNFFWSIWFFNLGWYLFAFLWLVALWILILATTVAFYRISKPAAWLMLPYLVWVAFAGYLNLGVWWLNR